MPKISALPPMSTAADDDEAPIVDTSVTTTKKWTLTLLKTYLQSLVAWITPAMWTNIYKARAYRNAHQAISASTWSKAQLNVESFDTNNNFDSVTNYRYTVAVTGYYHIKGQIGIGSAGISGSTYGEGSVYKNGAAIISGLRLQGSSNSNTLPRMVLTDLVYLVAGDYIELYGYSSDADRDIVGGSNITYLAVNLLSQT